MTTFKVGDSVRISSLKKNGMIVELLSNDKAKVSLQSLVVLCKLSDLSPAKMQKGGSDKAQLVSTSIKSSEVRPLDLHGVTVAEAIARLDQWLNNAILSGCDRAVVVHGHGTGRVKAAVYKRLAEIPAVKRVAVNELNRGESIVYLS